MNSRDGQDRQVVVEIDGKADSAGKDAATVFGALSDAYSCDRSADAPPRHTAGEHPSVWSATFDTGEVRQEPTAARLEHSVSATLQGGYLAVDQLCRTLSSAFEVNVVGTAAGDQEKEVQLRLESHR